MHTTARFVPLMLCAALAACGGSQPAEPAPAPAASSGNSAPAPAPQAEAPQPAQPAQHAEAHLNRGHITLEHQIQFDTGSDHINEEASRGPLTDLIALMRENTQIRRVRVEGHTDERGGAGANQGLSQRRAQAVATYLRGHGFENVEFEAVGYGSTQPLCREDNDACHERNRRVEFTITDPPPPAQ